MLRECLVLPNGISCYDHASGVLWTRPVLHYVAGRCLEWVCREVVREWKRCPLKSQDMVYFLNEVAL